MEVIGAFEKNFMDNQKYRMAHFRWIDESMDTITKRDKKIIIKNRTEATPSGQYCFMFTHGSNTNFDMKRPV